MSFEELWESRGDVVRTYFEALREYERMRPIENSAATCVQQYFRAFQVREDISKQRNAAIQIQKTWRGFLGRRKVKAMKSHLDYLEKQKQYDFYATKIQKM